MRKPPLGELEQELLRRVSERGAPVSVRELTEALREERGLARTTILTVLENLRKKNYLTRDKAESGGVFRYGPAVPKTEMLRGLVRGFVENALGGSVSPLVAYLANTDEINSGDLAELERLVDDLRRARHEREQKEGDE